MLAIGRFVDKASFVARMARPYSMIRYHIAPGFAGKARSYMLNLQPLNRSTINQV